MDLGLAIASCAMREGGRMTRLTLDQLKRNNAGLRAAMAELYKHHDQDELDATARALGRPDLIPDRQEDLPIDFGRQAA
jgi:hypothetical protein